MSREIKFRAWNTETNKMLSSSRLKEMQVFALSEPLAKETDNFLVIPTQDKYPLMQYTGLKDKNGIEIYEGDVVVTYFGNQKVSFQDGCYYAGDASLLDCLQIGGAEFEVIGNIYENKELLEK